MPGVTLPHTEVLDIRSRNGRAYRILIGKPESDPEPKGYPVLYLLDGNATFAIAAASAALQGRRPESTQVSPAVIVGIGYAVDDYLDPVSRTFDYTPAVDPADLPPRPDGSAWPPCGGEHIFLDFIETELKPLVGSKFPIDESRQAIFGHSFGGLFVLDALFTRPQSFRSYIASSPSIWLAKHIVHRRMNDFILQHRAGAARRNLLVTVGGLEGERNDRREVSGSAGPAEAWRLGNRMIGNAKDIVQQLSSASASAVNVTFNVFDDENHSSVLPAAVSRALRLALEPSK